jgi:Listeria/Bacterioides repeat
MRITNGCDIGLRMKNSDYVGKNMVLILVLAMFLFLLIGISDDHVYGTSSTAAISQDTDGIIVVYKDGTSNTKIKSQLKSNDSASSKIEQIGNENKYAVADVPSDQSVTETIKDYEKSSIVAYAQPNYIYKTMSTGTSFNDSFFSRLWHFSSINVAAAASDYASVSSATKVKVAVLDTGVYASHSDLQACLDTELSVDITSSDTGNYSTLTSDVDTTDSHGTHVTGIVAATANNGIGVAGVGSAITNNNLDVIVEGVFDYYESDMPGGGQDFGATTEDIIKGIDYAISKKVKVINMSLGYDTDGNDSALESALDECESAGISVVCAGGNDGTTREATMTVYPADYSTCISVTATDSNNEITSYSNHNQYKDISAPGGDGTGTGQIYSTLSSTVNSTGYGYMSGTSMATPVVTGVVAAMYSIDPKLTPAEVRSILKSTATDIGYSGSGYGSGLINAYAAVDKVINDYLSSSSSGSTSDGTAYTVTFNANGGSSVSTSSLSVTADDTISTLPNAVRKGYAFAGWYTSAIDGSKVTSSTAITSDMTLYAHWTKVSVAKAYFSGAYSNNRRIYVTAKSVSSAKGYQIKYSTRSSFSGSTYKSSSTKKITSGKLTKGKYYYVKVRAYKLDSSGSRVYGSWSSAKKIKIKA